MYWDKPTESSKQPTPVGSVLGNYIQSDLTLPALMALDNGADPDSKDNEGRPVICLAISRGNESVVEKLLERGADISTGVGDGVIIGSANVPSVLFALSLLLLQFFRLPGVHPFLSFAAWTLPVELHVGFAVQGLRAALLTLQILRTIVILYFLLEFISRHVGGTIGTFCFGTLHSASFMSYLSRRLLFILVTFIIDNTMNLFSTMSPAPQSPGIDAILELFGYEGDGERIGLLLLKHGLHLGNPNDTRNIFHSVWLWALVRGYPQIARILLQKGVSPTLLLFQDNHESPNILVVCAAKGHAEIVTLLLEHGSGVFKSNHLDAALMACVKEGSIKSQDRYNIVQQLLRHGANANSVCGQGRSALSWACEYSDSHILVDSLLIAGAGTTITHVNENGQTALHHVSSKHQLGSIETIDFLISAGAPINVTDRYGHTPLWEAASKGWPPAISLLLRRGAEPDFRGEGSTTPLMEVCRHGGIHNLPSIDILLAGGADPNACTLDDTPLISVLSREYTKERGHLVCLLLRAGAHPILPLDFPRQPLVESIGCTTKDGDWMYQLLEAAQITGPIPRVILDTAIERALTQAPVININGLQTLIQAGGNPSLRLKYADHGGTVMHLICESNVDFRGSTVGLLEFLVRSGVSVLDRDSSGRTPLHSAARAINKPAVEKLLELGCDIDAVDCKGRTALALGCETKPTTRTRYTPIDYHPDLEGPQFSGDRLRNYKAAVISEREQQVKRSIDIEDIIHLLCQSGTNLLASDHLGLTPLHLACMAGNPITAGVILQNRRQFQIFVTQPGMTNFIMKDLLSARDSAGLTPLHCAVRSGNVELVRMILAVDLNHGIGHTTVGRMKNVHDEMNRENTVHVADAPELINALDDARFTPLRYAVKNKHESIVRVFLDEVDICDRDTTQNILAIEDLEADPRKEYEESCNNNINGSNMVRAGAYMA